MLRHEAGDEVVDFALPACDRHALIVGEWKANVKGNQLSAQHSCEGGRSASSRKGTLIDTAEALMLLQSTWG
jgi:hypothetical protein